MANDFNEITNRLHSVRISDDPSTNHIVSGADEVYDDTAPYRTNGHITCNEVTPEGTENPKELNWYEKVVDTTDPTLFEWIRTNDETIDSSKTYGIPTGAKQNDINNQLYTMIGDLAAITVESGEVVTADESKIINKEDGYVPTAGAVGRALGANFEDKLDSTSITQGLTANMGRVLNENKADINGYYETMSVGSAKNLDGENTNSEAYLIRPTGGENNEVVSGLASVVGMEGNSCAWNQLIKISSYTGSEYFHFNSTTNECIIKVNTFANSNQSLPITIAPNAIIGHKYYIKTQLISGEYSGTINVVYGGVYGPSINSRIGLITAATTNTIKYGMGINGVTITQDVVFKIILIDVTLLGIDDLTTAAQVEEWIAQHLGTKPYYAYNAGTILSANTLGFKTYSRNLLNPSDGLAKLIPYTHTTNSNKYTVKGIPTGAVVTYTPDNTGVAVDVTEAITDNTFDISSYGIGTLYIPNATTNTYVCMKYDGTMDNEIVPYKESTYNFDVTKVYGKTGGSDEYVQCFPNGMRSAGSVHDILTANEAVVKIYSAKLGDYNYATDTVGGHLRFNTATFIQPEAKQGIDYKFSNQINSNGYINNGIPVAGNTTDHSISIYGRKMYLRDDRYSSSSVFRAAMVEANVTIDYELKTPITYTDLIYREGGVDRLLREVLVNLNVDNWSMEEQLVADYDEQGNPTSVPATIQTKYSIDAVEAIKTLEDNVADLQEATYTETEVRVTFGNLLDEINTNCSSILGGTFSIVNPTGKTLTFTFTGNASTNSTEENTETI